MPDLLVKKISADYHVEIREKWNLISTNRTAFDSVSFSVQEGKKLAVVGETGSGKSSLLKTLCGFLPISSGEIWLNEKRIDNLKVKQWKSLRKEIQIILQNPMTAFNPSISIKSSLFNVLNSHYTLSDSQKSDLLFSEMKLIHLADNLLNKLPNELSGGQLQRFSVIRSFLLNPKLLLCDEPMASLDQENQKLLLDYINTKSFQNKCSIIWVTHQLTFIDEFCDHILILKDGKVQDFGSLSDLKQNLNSEYSKTLLQTIH